ncbi:dTMP kinase [Radicibacter daui]|uniref:dTMP kinase n=1 Tax=Radicibacter daui TaxID=3064829 RepID=UPI0040468D03
MTAASPARGRFITFEGGEGAGKSTQIRAVADWLRQAGHEVLSTREPGGSPGAEDIRALFVRGEAGRWDGITETLLVYAARRDHIVKAIEPALAAGTWVLCDRFADSTLAYQGYGHGVDAATIREIHRLAVGDLTPDLTLILDIDPAIGLARSRGTAVGEDRFEKLGTGFHQRLRQGFLEIAAAEPKRCAVIDASDDVVAITAALKATISGRLGLERDGRADSRADRP